MTTESTPWVHPEDRYRNDGRFANIVDMFESMIHQAELTPFEVREAAMLAAIHYELRNAHHMFRKAAAGNLEPVTRCAVREMADRIEGLRRWMDETPVDEGGWRR